MGYIMTSLQPANVELCVATYRAEQIPGAVVIHAQGIHRTSGYQVFFDQAPITVFPPEFSLWHVKPAGIVLEVITPFAAHTTFRATQKVEKVIVHDAAGRHEVPVEQVPDFLMAHAR